MTPKTFRRKVRSYYKRNGRHDLAWRKRITPYRVLVSELMLQQTQVARVKDYFPRFVDRFSNFEELASVSRADVLELWQGLGYNRRALYLHSVAKEVVEKYEGVFPARRDEMESLPGIGPATSGALMAFAFDRPVVFIETNIRRVYLHHFFPDKTAVPDKEIAKKAEETLPRKNFREWYWALMDYGAALSRQTKQNPNIRSKHYTKQSKFEGSVRQARGAILRHLLKVGGASPKALQKELGFPSGRFKKALTGLEKERVVVSKSGNIAIAE